MKRIFFASIVFIFLYSCGNKKNIPDVSNINVQLDVQRFDKDFFSMDTNNIPASLDELQKKYGGFMNDYLYNILASPPQPDSVIKTVKRFIGDPNYQMVFDSAEKAFSSVQKMRDGIARGLQFVKYYFPDYKIPQHIVTFIGPMEGYANVLTGSGFAVGLQLYLGKDFSAYHSAYINEVYPDYISRRFEQPYIPVDCIKNIINDLYPDKSANLSLIYQMVEAGKRLYLLDHFLPETADSLKTGYTQKQLEGCFEHEDLIWNYFLQNNLLYINDPEQIKDYMNNGPKTEALGEASPGFIGQFVGWQIVKKWMGLDAKRTLPQLLQTSARQIFEEAKYKP